MNSIIRCRYTRGECEEPTLYQAGQCDLCDLGGGGGRTGPWPRKGKEIEEREEVSRKRTRPKEVGNGLD